MGRILEIPEGKLMIATDMQGNWDDYIKVVSTFGEKRRGGELIGDFDFLIASTALVNNLTLLTGNIKHFERVKGLQIKSS